MKKNYTLINLNTLNSEEFVALIMHYCKNYDKKESTNILLLEFFFKDSEYMIPYNLDPNLDLYLEQELNDLYMAFEEDGIFIIHFAIQEDKRPIKIDLAISTPLYNWIIIRIARFFKL